MKSITQVAEETGIKKGCIQEWIKGGFIPGINPKFQKGSTRILRVKEVESIKRFNIAIEAGFTREESKKILENWRIVYQRVYRIKQLRTDVRHLIKKPVFTTGRFLWTA